MVFPKEVVDSRPPELYYLFYWKKKTHAEDTWESVKKVFYLRQPFKKYYFKNSEKPTVTSSPINKSALPPLMATCLSTKIALFLLPVTHSSLRKYFLIHN